MRRSRLRRDRYEKLRKRDVECALGSSCVWPECTCPARERSTEAQQEAPPVRGRTVYRRPVGPVLPRKRRPKGWSPLSDWVVVRTKTRQENWAAQNCRQQDMETFLPRHMEPGSGVPKALFPGYLFVRPGDRWQKLRSTYGVLDVLTRGDRPEYVPKAVMRALRNNADKDGIVTLPKQRKPELGESVEIQIGAWKGFAGLYDGLDPEGRIRVLLSMFGRDVVLTFKRYSSVQVVNA